MKKIAAIWSALLKRIKGIGWEFVDLIHLEPDMNK
jgi:hypothetical protein